MLALIIKIEDWREFCNGEFCIGEKDGKVVVEVEGYLQCASDDITDEDVKFNQSAIAGKYDEFLNYQEVLERQELIAEYGDADSYAGLLKKKTDVLEAGLITANQAIIELDGGV
jgi:hypothetical protein